MRTVRVAAIADVHCRTTSAGTLKPLLARATHGADVLALCGDLTDTGLTSEAEVLADELRATGLPCVAVLGNHDHESGTAEDVRRILTEAGVQVLQGEACEILGIGFAGVKGFAGGFGRRALGAWGEDAIKAFVREAIDEALKLEEALAKLRTSVRVALLHYSPIEATVRGEPEQIYPFLGSSRLEDPIDRYKADLVLHGHAHFGSIEGRTRGGVPVYNVSLPLLRSRSYDPPIRVFELNVRDDGAPREERAIAEEQESPAYAGEVTPRSGKE
ncbi:MAG TPA: metallophosphoesterase [Candidatus Limnocylindria bacterium]